MKYHYVWYIYPSRDTDWACGCYHQYGPHKTKREAVACTIHSYDDLSFLVTLVKKRVYDC